MNDVIDEEWEEQWHVGLDADTDKSWKDYVVATRLEITCGEAPFLTSRYDTVSGAPIPPDHRVGILDRKLRKVSEHCTNADWTRWALLALGSVYGYEWQGDNLLLARRALLATFSEAYEQQFGAPADKTLLQQAAEIISWNIWQMDGLKAVVPDTCHEERHTSNDLFGSSASTTVTPCPGCAQNNILLHNGLRCRLRRWIASDDDLNNALPDSFDCLFTDFITKKYRTHHKTKWPMKFDFVIGNPPYQDESVGEQKTFMPPVYNQFMDAAYTVSDKIELITPARFLFDAGSTPTAWNKKMLNDKHLKVLEYEPDSSKVFANNEIKGGVAITYRNAKEDYGAILTFTPYMELNNILKKVNSRKEVSLSSIAISRTAYRLTDTMHKENPQAMAHLSKGHPYDMSTNIFDLLPFIFYDEKPNDGKDYIQILGREGNGRAYKYIRRDYVNDVENLDYYKVLLPEGAGNGAYGETLPTPLIGYPGLANTETFLSIGKFTSEDEAKNLKQYIKTKFTRSLLGILKVTQHITPAKFKYVPLQDFTSSSDIDWSKSVHEIDEQLYDKYGLTKEERDFIETHVKEME
jgi:type II restriction enzyme